MRRTKLLLWLPIAVAVVIDFFAMVLAGIISNTVTTGTLISIVWWAWLLLFVFSLVILGVWVAYWRRLPR